MLEMQKQLYDHQAQAEAMKRTSKEWSSSLEGKLKGLREEKKHWMADATSLKAENLGLKVRVY